jgi:hypothetical protein
MRTDAQIRIEASNAGPAGLAKLQLEVLLDVRGLLSVLSADFGAAREEMAKKVRKPRKKK